MYYVQKTLEIAGSHQLKLDYQSKCNSVHGHNWLITIYLKSEKLDSNDMVYDFTHIKEVITDKLDHKHLNDVLPFNPTAENIARWICDGLSKCYKVTVQESQGNIATYEKD